MFMKIGDLVELKKESIDERSYTFPEELQGCLLFIIDIRSKYETVATVVSPFAEGRLIRLFADDLKVVSPL